MLGAERHWKPIGSRAAAACSSQQLVFVHLPQVVAGGGTTHVEVPHAAEPQTEAQVSVQGHAWTAIKGPTPAGNLLVHAD
jgi:hypothetical protein